MTAPIDGVGGREALRARDQVGPDVVALGGEPRADAAEAGDHLVGDEQDAVAVADRADALEVARGRRERAAGVLDGLHDHHRDRLGAGLDDRRLEVVEQERGELLLGLAGRAVVAVRVADVDHVGDERLERGAQRRDAVDRERAHRGAVVGEPAGDAFQRRSPRAAWYARASFQAASTASEPPETKKTRFRSPGASAGELGRELDRAAGARSSSWCRTAARASARARPGRPPRRASSRSGR